MNTYNDYINNAGETALKMEEAMSIYNDMTEVVNICKIEDKMEFYDAVIKKACEYASIRAKWEYMTREEKMNADDGRTIKHNSFIDSLNILNRLVLSDGIESTWRDRLGDERKRIGDFACFISYITGICNR